MHLLRNRVKDIVLFLCFFIVKHIFFQVKKYVLKFFIVGLGKSTVHLKLLNNARQLLVACKLVDINHKLLRATSKANSKLLTIFE